MLVIEKSSGGSIFIDAPPFGKRRFDECVVCDEFGRKLDGHGFLSGFSLASVAISVKIELPRDEVLLFMNPWDWPEFWDDLTRLGAAALWAARSVWNGNGKAIGPDCGPT